MRYIFTVIILGLLFYGCYTDKNTSCDQTLIINLAVDSALKLDPGLNTNDYWIDFSKVQYFTRPAINDFLKEKKNFTEINGDSLIKNDSTWNQYGFLQQMLIKFKTVEIKGDLIIINLDKIKASDGSNGIEVIIKKTGNNYKVNSSRITWIS